MMSTQSWLNGLRLGSPQVVKDVFAVFPLTAESANGRNYLTLEEAYRQRRVVLPESGEVPEIRIRVKGDKPVLVLEGEVLIGGWQNRTVNLSLLLDGDKEHTIPVSCIEAGRWSGRWHGYWDWRDRERRRERAARRGRRASQESAEEMFEDPSARDTSVHEETEQASEGFSLGWFSGHARLRRRKTAAVVAGYKHEGNLRGAQSQVWEEVDRKLRVARLVARTSDATRFFVRYGASVEAFLDPIKVQPGQVGAVVAIGDEVVGMDVLDHPETWGLMQRKILAGYAADALEAMENFALQEKGKAADPSVAAPVVRSVAEEFAQATVKPAPVGLGEHHLLVDETGGRRTFTGFALVHDSRTLHLFAFPTGTQPAE